MLDIIKYGYIYMSINLINGMRYIGLHRSRVFDYRYFGSGVIIRKALIKYGYNNFIVLVLQWCYSEEELISSEIAWIKKFDAANSPMFYNISNGGEGYGGLSGDKNPAKRPDVRAKMSANHADFSGKNNPNYGGLSEINKRHISESRIAKGTAKGPNNPMYGKRDKDSPHYGRIHINNGEISKTCSKEELETYLSNGWKRGRIVRNPSKSSSSTTIESVVR